MCFFGFMSYLHCSYHLTDSLTVTNYFSFSPHYEIGNPCVQQRMMNGSTGQTQQFAEPGDFGQCHEWKTGLEPKPGPVLVLWEPFHSWHHSWVSLCHKEQNPLWSSSSVTLYSPRKWNKLAAILQFSSAELWTSFPHHKSRVTCESVKWAQTPFSPAGGCWWERRGEFGAHPLPALPLSSRNFLVLLPGQTCLSNMNPQGVLGNLLLTHGP